MSISNRECRQTIHCDLIRRIVNEVLAALDSEFGRLYATVLGRPPPQPKSP